MLSNADDDEDLFVPASSSNLASLFGTSMNIVEDSNTSLIYTAPKQPKSRDNESENLKAKPNPQSSIVCADFVDVFKLIDKEPIAQGKCGIAIISNEAVKSFEIIIYKSKQDIIMRTRFRDDFIFVIQSNNFVYICDEQKQEWSIHFKNAATVDCFAQMINLQGARVFVAGDNKGCKTPQLKDKDSDSHSDTSTNKTKANILSRMAKMGQSILPHQVTAESESDSEDTASNRRSIRKRPPKHLPMPNRPESSNSETPEYALVNGQVMPIVVLKQPFQSMPTQNMSSVSDPLQVFLAENRTHNCEVRMNIMQLSLKLDKVLQELAKTKTESTGKFKENELIPKQIIASLRQQNEEQQNVIRQYEDKTAELQRNVNQEGYEQTIAEQIQIIKNLEKTIEEQRTNLDKLTKRLEEKESSNNMEIVNKLNDKVSALETQLETKQKMISSFSKKLKRAMNVLYNEIIENFDKDSSFQGSEIKDIFSQQFINSTLAIIQELQNDFKNT